MELEGIQAKVEGIVLLACMPVDCDTGGTQVIKGDAVV